MYRHAYFSNLSYFNDKKININEKKAIDICRYEEETLIKLFIII